MRTKEKKRGALEKTLGILLFGIGLFLFPMMQSEAATINFSAKVEELKVKFPHEKYWNHVGMENDNSDGYTDQPCVNHKKSGVDHVYGKGGCTCNHFACTGHLPSTQCMGFANKLGYDVFGDTTWTIYNNPTDASTQIQVGDIVRIAGEHSVFVIGKEGNSIIVGEANYPKDCQISWGRTIDLTTATVSYYERANNYAEVIDSNANGGNQPEIPNIEENQIENPGVPKLELSEPTTGFILLEDGIHYCYYKDGRLQKNKWIKVEKKRYYMDESGYRVTGLSKIGEDTYYFNTKGERQRKKWVTVDGDSYYLGEDGFALKSQWLYKDNLLVYVKGNGVVAKSEIVKIGHRKYYFNSKSKRSKGFKKYKGKHYYCDKYGIIQKKKWITKGNKRYYLQKSGQRAEKKLVKIGKYKYYFNEKGYLQKKKKVTYKGKIYRADKRGRCKFVDFCENESEF